MNCFSQSLACLMVLSMMSLNGILAQIKESIPPQSVLLQLSKDQVSSYVMKPLNFEKIALEDEQNISSTRDLRFAVPRDVNINIKTHGEWIELEGKGKLWRLMIESPNALGTILEYNQFHLPQGSTLHLYNEDGSHLVGAFSSRNNKGSLESPGTFLSELIKGRSVILEYFEPFSVENTAVISISRVMLAYRNVNHIKKYKDFSDSGACQVNINCPDGTPWQTNKLAVSRMLIITPGGAGWCTGQMLTTIQGGFRPYYLTANHCIEDSYDATGTNNVNAIFYWDYEAAGCSNPSSEPASITSSGALLVANKADSDFALFWLLEDPFRDAGFVPSYLGWDPGTSPGAGGACIHHPAGDIKKISLFTQTPGSNAFCDEDLTWNVVFNHGGGQFSSTEPGSSGSALFDNNGRVIGQLWGGTDLGTLFCNPGPECADPEDDRSYYGKFSDSWGDSGGKRRRLSDWLATPCNTNTTHSVNVTNTGEMYYADNAVTSSAGIYDNSSTRATVVAFDGGNRVDLLNGFEVDGNANLFIRNEADCPAARQAAPDGLQTADMVQPAAAFKISNESIEE